jgi:hypothetical protein
MKLLRELPKHIKPYYQGEWLLIRHFGVFFLFTLAYICIIMYNKFERWWEYDWISNRTRNCKDA